MFTVTLVTELWLQVNHTPTNSVPRRLRNPFTNIKLKTLDIVSSPTSFQDRYHFQLDIISNSTSYQAWHQNIIRSTSYQDPYQDRHYFKIDIISSSITDQGRHHIMTDIIDIISRLISFPAWYQIKVNIISRSTSNSFLDNCWTKQTQQPWHLTEMRQLLQHQHNHNIVTHHINL
jgi:hypothetical protein